MRCKACNNILSGTEIIWDEEKQEHEFLCRYCRDIVEGLEDEVALSHLEDYYGNSSDEQELPE